MAPRHYKKLADLMENFLQDCDEDGGNPQWCYDKLHEDMAKAAAIVYDSCMSGQVFAEQQKS